MWKLEQSTSFREGIFKITLTQEEGDGREEEDGREEGDDIHSKRTGGKEIGEMMIDIYI